MKNWDPFVCAPLFAIDSKPGLEILIIFKEFNIELSNKYTTNSKPGLGISKYNVVIFIVLNIEISNLCAIFLPLTANRPKRSEISCYVI